MSQPVFIENFFFLGITAKKAYLCHLNKIEKFLYPYDYPTTARHTTQLPPEN